MQITKVPQGSLVTVTFSSDADENQSQITARAIQGLSKSSGLLCEANDVDFSELNTTDSRIHANVLNNGDNRNYEFYCTGIKVQEESKRIILFCNEDAPPINYRRAPRYAYDAKATITLSNNETFEAQLHDLSKCGLCFILPQRTNINPRDVIGVNFYAEESGWNFKLKVTTVRVKNLEHGEQLVGCNMTDYYPTLVAFCNKLASINEEREQQQ